MNPYNPDPLHWPEIEPVERVEPHQGCCHWLLPAVLGVAIGVGLLLVGIGLVLLLAMFQRGVG